MRKKIALILIGVLIALMITLFIHSVIVNGGVTSTAALRLTLSLAITISSIVKIVTGTGGMSLARRTVEKQYADIIGKAFAEPDRKRLRKKLTEAIYIYFRPTARARFCALKNCKRNARLPTITVPCLPL